MLQVDREQVLAHRIAALGLHRDGHLDPVLSLGLQDSGPSARLMLAARTPAGEPTDPAARGLVEAWTHRGAPHHHRPEDMAELAAAARPLDDADAGARLNWSGPEQHRVGIPAAEAVDRTADALAEVVVEPMTKGAASTAVTARLPAALLRECRGCACVHVNEQLFRLAAWPAGVGLEAGPPLLLTPPPVGWARPRTADPRRAARLVLDYLRVLGPGTAVHAAGFVGTSTGAFGPAWREALETLKEVRIDGARAWLPAADLPALENPPEPDVVRLLPPYDPMLQLRDRELLVPDEDRRRELYRPIGNPGVVLADGEVVGTWRPKVSGRRLTLDVSGFVPWAPDVRARVDDEAQRVAEARGMTLAALRTTE